jgi:hypothetical protein
MVELFTVRPDLAPSVLLARAADDARRVTLRNILR